MKNVKNVWRTTGEKTTYLDEGKYIAVRLTEYRTIFFPYPKYTGKSIREYIKMDFMGYHEND